jgi:hypothetical protein
MENLINDLIDRLENIKVDEKTRIIQFEKRDMEDSIRILLGKIMAIDYCISELQRMITYAHQSETNR